MKYVLIAAALLGTPALGQQPAGQLAPSSAAPAPLAEPDPERLALARTTAAALLPPGSYQRMMQTTMSSVSDSVTASMFDMRAVDVVPQGSGNDADVRRELGDRTLGELAAEADPHFEERMRITNRVMFAEMIPVVTRLEPEVREGLARAYAKKFTREQLVDMNRFFATPSGSAFATESLSIWMDPEIMSLMGKLGPEIIQEMPRIMEKVSAATAHLPQPPEPKKRRKRR